MNCQEVMELMQRDLDRDLNDTEREAMMDHLRQCPECADMFDRLHRLSLELENLPKVNPPFSLVDAIMPRLDEIDRVESGGAAPAPSCAEADFAVPVRTERPRRLRGAPYIAAAGGAVAAGLLLTLFIGNMGGMKSADESGLMPERLSVMDQAGNGMAAGTSGSGSSADTLMRGTAKEKADAAAKSIADAQADAAASVEQKAGSPKAAEGAGPGAAAGSARAVGSADAAGRSGGQEKRSSASEPAPSAMPSRPSAAGQTADPNQPASSGPVAAATNQTPAGEAATGPSSGTEGTSGESSAQPPADGKGTEPFALRDKEEKTGPKGTSEEVAGVPPVGAKEADRIPMGITFFQSEPVTEMRSEDGAHIAYLDAANRRIVIRTAGEKPTEVFTSTQWSDKDRAELVGWTGSAQFHYSVTAPDGATKTIVIDIANKTETVKP